MYGFGIQVLGLLQMEIVFFSHILNCVKFKVECFPKSIGPAYLVMNVISCSGRNFEQQI